MMIATNHRLIDNYYRQNMLCWYDGIENTSVGHQVSPNIWKDLANNNDLTIFQGTSTFDSKSCILNGNTILSTLNRNNDFLKIHNGTLEVVFALSNKSLGIIFTEISNGGISPGRSLWYRPSTNNLVLSTGRLSANEHSGVIHFDYDTYIHHVCIEYKTGLAEAYLDGISVQVGNPAGTMSNRYTYTVGGAVNYTNGNGEYYFNGNIYAIRLYSLHLSDAQRLNNYNIDKQRFNF